MHKALIIGADGAIGGALCHHIKKLSWGVDGTALEGNASNCDHSYQLDLAAKPNTWPYFAENTPDVVFVLAAISSLKDCADAPEVTRRINVEHTVALAELFVSAGAFVVFPSTNLVFDGTVPNCQSDVIRNPQTEYGRQKAEAEERLLALGERVAVVRLAKVLSPAMALLEGWRESLLAGKPITAFTDLKVAPVSIDYTLKVLTAIAERELPGIFQISAPEEITYYDLAARLAVQIGADPGLVNAVSSADAGAILETAPRHVRLNDDRVARELGLPSPTIKETLALIC